MNKVILAGIAYLLSMSAFAETTSQIKAKEMSKVLQSKEVLALLSQEDGVGNLKGIKYLFSYRATFGPAIYELSFESHSGPTPQLCTIPVEVNMLTSEVMKVNSAVCKEVMVGAAFPF